MTIIESRALYNIACDGRLTINGKDSTCKYANGSDTAITSCGTWCPLLIAADSINEIDWGSWGKKPQGAVALCLCGCTPLGLVRTVKAVIVENKNKEDSKT